MKKIALPLIVSFLLLFTVALKGEAKTSFTDVSDSYWAKEEIQFLANQGIIKGYSNGKFGVNENIKRSQAAVMLARALNLNLENRPNPGFKDVPKSHASYKQIAAVVDEGFFSKAAKFNPDAQLTRAEMAKVLTNAYKLSYSEDVSFKDVSQKYWGARYISALASNGVTLGYPDLTFKPGTQITRAHFSVFLARTINDEFKSSITVLPKKMEEGVYYPVVRGLDSASEDKINRYLYEKGLQGKAAYADMKEMAREMSSLDPLAKYYTYTMDYKVKVSNEENISILFNDYEYAGGAHGLYHYTAFNFDSATGAKYDDISELFDDSSYGGIINREVRSQIYQRVASGEFSSFDTFYSIDPYTEDFYITNEGVGVYFGLYEYTSFADGIPEFVIPNSLFY